MLFPNIFGSIDTRDLRTPPAQLQGGIEAITADIQRWQNYYNTVADLYFGSLVGGDVTTGKETFGTGDVGGEMQPYTEYGQTEGTRTQESQWESGYPIRRYRDRVIYTEEYLATATVEEISRDTVAATNRNVTTRLKSVLRAILINTNYVFVDAKRFPFDNLGNLTIYRLFNADASTGTITINGVRTNIGAIQSYVTSGNATINANHFALARQKLTAVGNTGRVRHIISPDDEVAVRAVVGFVPKADPVQYVTVTNPNTPTITPILTEPQSIGVISNGTGDGEVVMYPFFPSGYTLSYDTTKEKPCKVRRTSNARFRGWKLIQDQQFAAYGDGDLRNKRWEDIFGVGVFNRANGVVVQATVSGTYTAPVI